MQEGHVCVGDGEGVVWCGVVQCGVPAVRMVGGMVHVCAVGEM